MYYQNYFITDFKEKGKLPKQCSLLANHSKLSTSLSFQTNKQLFSVTFSAKDKGKIIQGLNHNKTHGHDISICMLKICGGTIYKSSEMIFSQALTYVLFRFEWKQGNIVPIHGKMINKT